MNSSHTINNQFHIYIEQQENHHHKKSNNYQLTWHHKVVVLPLLAPKLSIIHVSLPRLARSVHQMGKRIANASASAQTKVAAIVLSVHAIVTAARRPQREFKEPMVLSNTGANVCANVKLFTLESFPM